MSLVLAGISKRCCPKCKGYSFWIETTTIGESYEICQDCGYTEKNGEPKRFVKVDNLPFSWDNYIKDPEGNYHNHGKFGWHKVSVKHRRVQGQLYAFSELEEAKA